jgi:hypothetical protein
VSAVGPEPRHDYAALTGEQLAQVADEIRPIAEGLLRLHGLLHHDEPLHIVDGHLALPDGTPEDFLGWPLDCLAKAAADRLLAQARTEAADTGRAQ